MSGMCGSTDTADGKPCRNQAGSCPIAHKGRRSAGRGSAADATAPLQSNIVLQTLPPGVGGGSLGLAGNPGEFAGLLNRAKAAVGLAEDSIVRDYWLTTCLHNLSLAGSDHEMRAFREIKGIREPTAVCVFTGGTSLVSAWGITERYSEDLDFLAADLTDGSARETLKKARSQFSDWVKEPLGQTQHPIAQDDDRKKGYRKIRLSVGAQKDYLKVEIASEEIPSELQESRPIVSLMGRFATTQQRAQYPELGGFELLCTKPVYTAANKLDALHRRAEQGHFRGISARVRDLYDLAMIAQSEYADGARDGIPDLAEQAAHSFGRGGDSVPRPARGYAASILFKEGSEAQTALKTAYPYLTAFVWGDLPPFEDALELAAGLDDRA